MLVPVTILLLRLVTYSKVSFATICQDSNTKNADVFIQECPELFSGQEIRCYNVTMVSEAKDWPTGCSGFAADLDNATQYISTSDHKPCKTQSRIRAVSQTEPNEKGNNWIWIDKVDWDVNFCVKKAIEKNCTNILTANGTYTCDTLPCGENCSFICKGFCKSRTKEYYEIEETRQDNKRTLKCHYGPDNATMEATCINSTTEEWNFDETKCQSKRKLLSKLTVMTITESNVLNATETVGNLTMKEGGELNSTDIADISRILFNIANFTGELPKQIFETFYQTIDNVLKINETIISRSNAGTGSSSNSFIDAVETISKKHEFPKNGVKHIANLTNLKIILSTAANASHLSLNIDAIVNVTENSPTNVNVTEMYNIELSQQAFDKANTSKVVFILYRKTSFFKPTKDTMAEIRGYVIAVSMVSSEKIEDLNKPVVLRYPKSKEVNVSEPLRCVFWKLIRKPNIYGWSGDGCTFKRNDTYNECHCNHLTSFAVILDLDPGTVSDKHKEILSLLSYTGCSLSFLGILLILLTMFIFKELLASTSSKIFLNICIALGAALAVFLVAAERRETFSDTHCTAAGMLNHFLFLAALAWMVLEAYTMYFAFVKLLPKESFEAKIPPMWISCLICWGIPGVIVGITAGMTRDSYMNNKYCLLQGFPAVLAFLVPVALCVFVNAIIFVFILRSLVKSGSRVTSTKKTSGFEQVRRGMAISVYLGLTWISGLFAIGDAKIFFHYLFCIFNSTQGFLIFLFYCVLSTEVRGKYRARFCARPAQVARFTAITETSSALELCKIAATLDLRLARMRATPIHYKYEKPEKVAAELSQARLPYRSRR